MRNFLRNVHFKEVTANCSYFAWISLSLNNYFNALEKRYVQILSDLQIYEMLFSVDKLYQHLKIT